jgi:hypothetical protein
LFDVVGHVFGEKNVHKKIIGHRATYGPRHQSVQLLLNQFLDGSAKAGVHRHFRCARSLIASLALRSNGPACLSCLNHMTVLLSTIRQCPNPALSPWPSSWPPLPYLPEDRLHFPG